MSWLLMRMEEAVAEAYEGGRRTERKCAALWHWWTACRGPGGCVYSRLLTPKSTTQVYHPPVGSSRVVIDSSWSSSSLPGLNHQLLGHSSALEWLIRGRVPIRWRAGQCVAPVVIITWLRVRHLMKTCVVLWNSCFQHERSEITKSVVCCRVIMEILKIEKKYIKWDLTH